MPCARQEKARCDPGNERKTEVHRSPSGVMLKKLSVMVERRAARLVFLDLGGDIRHLGRLGLASSGFPPRVEDDHLAVKVVAVVWEVGMMSNGYVG